MKILKSIKYTSSRIQGGYSDRILDVDLSLKRISILETDPEFKEKYIGGRGYALKLLWDRTNENTRYDSPENVLTIAGGPLCNEPRFPGAGKFVAGAVSPLTDTFMDSNAGGYFASILKACGFDAIAVSGISGERALLTIDDDKGEIALVEAPEFDPETERGAISYGEAVLKKLSGGVLHKNIAALTTGAGAENTRFGLINSHFYDSQRGRLRTKQAGRGGLGTVMRVKGLMAIVVKSDKARSKGNNPVDPQGVKQAGSALAKVINREDPKQLNLSLWGTSVLVEIMNNFHLLPVNNSQKGRSPEAKAVFSDIFLKKYLKKKRADGCYFGCNLACAKGAEEVEIDDGLRATRKVGIDGPEYETAAAVTCLGIFDPQFVMEFNWRCDEYGMDTISMGVSAGFLMECFQRGFLTEEDAGYDLSWGNIDSARRLLRETALGLGIGKVCGMGVKRAKEWIAQRHCRRTGEDRDKVEAELGKFAMEAKGLEFSMYISKESLAQQGGYGLALKGPQHDEAWLIFMDQVHKELEGFERKAAALKWFPLVRTWFNAAGLCKLPWIDVRNSEAEKTDDPSRNMPSLELYVRFLNSTVGSRKSLEDILRDSERLHLLQKMINLRQGKGTGKYDQIPLRAIGPAFIDEFEDRDEYYNKWLEENMEEGQNLPVSNREKHELLLEMRKEAYARLCDVARRAKGYDRDGLPLPEILKKFDLYDEKAQAILARHRTRRELPGQD